MSPASASGAAADLARLRHHIAAVEHGPHPPPGLSLDLPPGASPARLALGADGLDAVLGGGLAWGGLHEAAADSPGQEGALAAFALGLAGRAARARARPVLVARQELAVQEAGALYGPGLAAWGLPADALLLVRVRTPRDLLFVMEEGLKCQGLAAVLGECAVAFPEALTATRRLSLAARETGTLGLLLRQRPDPAPCAALTRWRLAPAPSDDAPPDDAFGGLSPPRLAATLSRNRSGPTGRFLLSFQDGAFRQHPFPAQPFSAQSFSAEEQPYADLDPSSAPRGGGAAIPFALAAHPGHRPDRTADVA